MPPKRAPANAKKAPAAAAAGKRKKLSFSESTVKAASAAVKTTQIDSAKHAPKTAATKKTPPQQQQQKKNNSGGAAAPAAATAAPAPQKKVAVADMKGSGIVKAKQAKKRVNFATEAAEKKAKEEEELLKAKAAQEDGDDSSDDEADMLNGKDDDDDDLSDVADRQSSDSEGDEEVPKTASNMRGKKATVTAPYRVVRLSFLPPEFQEPQLYKFLNQFGATVLNCFCVRSKRTHRSKGIAYVEFDKESVIPLVVEECNGMALGGMSVRARPVTMHRAMPSRKMVTRRRALAYAYRTKGAPLKKHDVSKKAAIALLIKAARTEKQNNEHLKKLGVDFSTDFFLSQMKSLPPGVFQRRGKKAAAAEKKKKSGDSKAANGKGKATAKKAPRQAPKTAAPKRAAPKKATPAATKPKSAPQKNKKK